MHNILVGDTVRFTEAKNKWFRGKVEGIEIRCIKEVPKDDADNRRPQDTWVPVVKIKHELSNERYVLVGTELKHKELMVLNRG